MIKKKYLKEIQKSLFELHKFYLEKRIDLSNFILSHRMRFSYEKNNRKISEKFSSYLIAKLEENRSSLEDKEIKKIKRRINKAVQNGNDVDLLYLSEIFDYSDNKYKVHALKLFSNQKEGR